jgi:short-subunit dehydrogenase
MSSRAAIVTGGSRGIGFAVAEALGEEGYGLTLTARQPDTLQSAAQQLREQGFEVEYLAAP